MNAECVLKFRCGPLATVDTPEVELIAKIDRPALCRMLHESDDFPQHLLYLYQRSSGPHQTFVAWRAGELVGMLTGSFDANLFELPDFDSFELPPAPHALLVRVHVRHSARGVGIGRALIERYATEADARGCTFIGGSVDLSSDSSGRRAFFERLGFLIRDRDSFGAQPWQIGWGEAAG
jgi:GNAT superfamily N-acetyltransferase